MSAFAPAQTGKAVSTGGPRAETFLEVRGGLEVSLREMSAEDAATSGVRNAKALATGGLANEP